jgi:hypothetical protein
MATDDDAQAASVRVMGLKRSAGSMPTAIGATCSWFTKREGEHEPIHTASMSLASSPESAMARAAGFDDQVVERLGVRLLLEGDHVLHVDEGPEFRVVRADDADVAHF